MKKHLKLSFLLSESLNLEIRFGTVSLCPFPFLEHLAEKVLQAEMLVSSMYTTPNPGEVIVHLEPQYFFSVPTGQAEEWDWVSGLAVLN